MRIVHQKNKMSVSERMGNTMNSDINWLQREKIERNHDEDTGN